METTRSVRCPANEAVALYLFNKRQEMAAHSTGFSENLDTTLSKAYASICASKTPIKTLKDLSQIKGVGKWILTLMKGFFSEEPSPSSDSPSKNASPQKGKKKNGPRRYVPQKHSVSYALLITLYRQMVNGNTFMKKQELIDAAEASGLSRTSIGPDKAKGRPGQLGSTARDWYTGWSCMKTLISKGLVVKSSCPAKYMLTDEGTEAARDCLSRSGLELANIQPINLRSQDSLHGAGGSDMDCIPTTSQTDPMLALNQSTSATKNMQICQVDISNSDDSDSDSDSLEIAERTSSVMLATSTSYIPVDRSSYDLAPTETSLVSSNSIRNSLTVCSILDSEFRKSRKALTDGDIINTLAMPPHQPGESFRETYDVILILDERENFGSRFRKVVDNIISQFHIPVEVTRLPVGDGLWIVRHKQSKKEYVLDFIVERKNVDDLRGSIRDNRYRDQKLRLQRCGLKKLIYLIEGDPNSVEAAESIKTACFTTEILEGFDVQRTTGFADTVRMYGHLTKSIIEYYSASFSGNFGNSDSKLCPSFQEFVRRCQDIEKMTVSDVFALQLMQVAQVTEEVALAVVEVYPTLLSLAKAYSLLGGDVLAQEELLRNKCKAVSSSASRNIFKMVWSTS